MRLGIALAGLAASLLVTGTARAADEPGLTPFRSSGELNAWVETHTPQDAPQDPPQENCPPDWGVCPGYEREEAIVVTGSRVNSSPGITNNQEEGVDEGDIVKMHGDTLVILRRGRLFTIDTSRGGLKAIDRVDAFPAGIDPDDAWYDEMLVARDWVVVIGFSYGLNATEINRFRIDGRGRLTYVDTHHLTSEDYYSSRNYASRLIGDQLVLYTPGDVYGEDPLDALPTLARWRGDGREPAPRRYIEAKDVYRAPPLASGAVPPVEAVHSVTRCDLTRPVLRCRGTAVLGPEPRSFYVAEGGVYVWMTHRAQGGAAAESFVYRVPVNGDAPQVARTMGGPIDQMSFLEDPEAGRLHVLVQPHSDGDSMWRPEFSEGHMALLSLPLSAFGDGTRPVDPADYRFLPEGPTNRVRVVNRFTRTHALYSEAEGGYWSVRPSMLTVVPLTSGRAQRFLLNGSVERIEPVGDDAVVVSRLEDSVEISNVDLVRDPDPRWPDAGSREDYEPRISDVFSVENAEGAETRSHAFFYQADAKSEDGEFGVMGFPVFKTDDEPLETDADIDEAADMLFLRRGNDALAELGLLYSRPESQADDGCVASCVDWYGDARPIFVNGRVFALLGYELVEGRPSGRRMEEVRRVTFAPPAPAERGD